MWGQRLSIFCHPITRHLKTEGKGKYWNKAWEIHFRSNMYCHCIHPMIILFRPLHFVYLLISLQSCIIPVTQLSSISCLDGYQYFNIYLVLSMQLFHVTAASYLSECKTYKLTKFRNTWVYEKGPHHSQSFRLIDCAQSYVIVPWKLLASKPKANGFWLPGHMSVHVILASYQNCAWSNVFIDYCLNCACSNHLWIIACVVCSKGQGCTTVEEVWATFLCVA